MPLFSISSIPDVIVEVPSPTSVTCVDVTPVYNMNNNLIDIVYRFKLPIVVDLRRAIEREATDIRFIVEGGAGANPATGYFPNSANLPQLSADAMDDLNSIATALSPQEMILGTALQELTYTTDDYGYPVNNNVSDQRLYISKQCVDVSNLIDNAVVSKIKAQLVPQSDISISDVEAFGYRKKVVLTTVDTATNKLKRSKGNLPIPPVSLRSNTTSLSRKGIYSTLISRGIDPATAYISRPTSNPGLKSILSSTVNKDLKNNSTNDRRGRKEDITIYRSAQYRNTKQGYKIGGNSGYSYVSQLKDDINSNIVPLQSIQSKNASNLSPSTLVPVEINVVNRVRVVDIDFSLSKSQIEGEGMSGIMSCYIAITSKNGIVRYRHQLSVNFRDIMSKMNVPDDLFTMAVRRIPRGARKRSDPTKYNFTITQKDPRIRTVDIYAKVVYQNDRYGDGWSNLNASFRKVKSINLKSPGYQGGTQLVYPLTSGFTPVASLQAGARKEINRTLTGTFSFGKTSNNTTDVSSSRSSPVLFRAVATQMNGAKIHNAVFSSVPGDSFVENTQVGIIVKSEANSLIVRINNIDPTIDTVEILRRNVTKGNRRKFKPIHILTAYDFEKNSQIKEYITPKQSGADSSAVARDYNVRNFNTYEYKVRFLYRDGYSYESSTTAMATYVPALGQIRLSDPMSSTSISESTLKLTLVSPQTAGSGNQYRASFKIMGEIVRETDLNRVFEQFANGDNAFEIFKQSIEDLTSLIKPFVRVKVERYDMETGDIYADPELYMLGKEYEDPVDSSAPLLKPGKSYLYILKPSVRYPDDFFSEIKLMLHDGLSQMDPATAILVLEDTLATTQQSLKNFSKFFTRFALGLGTITEGEAMEYRHGSGFELGMTGDDISFIVSVPNPAIQINSTQISRTFDRKVVLSWSISGDQKFLVDHYVIKALINGVSRDVGVAHATGDSSVRFIDFDNVDTIGVVQYRVVAMSLNGNIIFSTVLGEIRL